MVAAAPARPLRGPARVLLAAGLAAALAAALAGCSSPAPPEGPAGTPVSPPAARGAGTTGAAATTTQGAELRAGLTWLLVDRAHLLALARRAALAGDTGALQDARTLLEDGATELAAAVGGAAAPLLASLRVEVEVVRDRRRTGPDLVDALVQAHADTVAVLADRVPALRAPVLATALDRSTAGLGAARPSVDAQESGVAAGVLANPLAAERGLGPTETSAAVLRADLVRALVARAHLVGDPADQAALDEVTGSLAARLAPGLQREPVLAALRAGHAALLGGARAARARDAAALGRARAALAAADRDLAARVEAAAPALPADLVLRELDPARGPLLLAVGARAVGADDAPSLSAAAARQAVVAAAALSAGLAEERRLR